MPPIGMLMGKVDFSSLFINLSGQPYPSLAAAKAAGAPTINYGVFGQTVLDFLIVSFVIFLVVRQINAMSRKTEAPPTTPRTKECAYCLSTMPLQATRCAHCASDQRAA